MVSQGRSQTPLSGHTALQRFAYSKLQSTWDSCQRLRHQAFGTAPHSLVNCPAKEIVLLAVDVQCLPNPEGAANSLIASRNPRFRDFTWRKLEEPVP
jgi:hypothetical protein